MTIIGMLLLAALFIPAILTGQGGSVNAEATVIPRLDGNRLAAGKGALPSEPRRIDLPGRPAWVVGVEVPDAGSRWIVALEDGQIVRVNADSSVEIIGQLAPGQPPTVTSTGELAAAPDDLSPLGYSVNYEGARYYISAGADGYVVRAEGGQQWRKDAHPLTDARVAISETGMLAVYIEPTTRYAHGVLGDSIEAAGLQVYDLRGGRFELSGQALLPPDDVFEGLSPLWGDLDGDGLPELITTVSNASSGARIVVYALRLGTGAPGLFNLQVLAEGEAIGRGGRWRHQIAVGPFGADGQTELVAVRTPHIGGIVEFYRLEQGRLVISATLSGYTSHQLGSRNLDMAQAGDFDGDGQVELAVPTQARDALAGVVNAGSAGQEVWRVELGGHAVSNLASIARADGTLALALGLEENTLLVWN